MSLPYILYWKDIPVLAFSREKQAGWINQSKAPFSIIGEEDPYTAIRQFCADRVMHKNRKYCKEILTSCSIDDQSYINICIVGKALSFYDNFWIDHEDSGLNFADVNLYTNPISKEICYTALSGESCSVHIGDRLYTGELTGKGTKAKCFFRENDSIHLAKAQSPYEDQAEILCSEIANSMRLPASLYRIKDVFGKSCSVCEIKTSPNIEMIHARDVLRHFRCDMQMKTKYYSYFMNADPINFVKMQVFDYITMNSDRNRDNFALKAVDGKITGLYDLYDHGSCFKAKSEDAIYFVTGMTFKDTMKILKIRYHSAYKRIRPDIANLQKTLKNERVKEVFCNTGFLDEYEAILERTEKAIEKEKGRDISKEKEL